MQHGQKAMALGPGIVAAERSARIDSGLARAPFPAGLRRTQDGINSSTFFACRLRAGEVKVQSVSWVTF
jgi:hypothetical protein